jgi:glycine/D-amino acid oxidase-like deaminating enzyme
MSEVEHCDVLCVGSGAGGLSAAIAAGHLGASVTVVEAADRLGGAAAYSGGQVWVGNTDRAKEAGIEDSEEDVGRYLEWLSEGRAEASLRDVYVSRGAEAIRFLRRCGVPLGVVSGMPDYYFPAAPGSKAEGRIHEIEPWDERGLGELADLVATSPYGAGWLSTQDRVDCGGQAPTSELEERRRVHVERGERCGGPGLAAALAASAAAAGAAFHTRTRAIRLLVDGDRVSGAIVTDAGGEREIRAAAGVILATGGYDWDVRRMEDLDRLPRVHSMAPATTRGDHFDLAEPLGGALAVVRQPHTSGTVFGTHTPGEDSEGRPVFRYFTPGLPHSIVVNSTGRRFADDSFHMTLVAGIAAESGGAAPNWPAWVITDQSYHDKYPFGAIAPGAAVPDGISETASDLAGLAADAGIDPEGLVDEVHRFNGFCDRGEDADFGRGSLPYTLALHGDRRMPNRNLGAILKPPFRAFPLSRVGVNCPAAGLVTGPDGAVHDREGEEIPGLYAAGNCSAQLDIGAGYNSGMGNQRGLLYGYLAASALSGSSSAQIERNPR